MASRPSKLAFTRDRRHRRRKSWSGSPRRAAPRSGDESPPKPGDGGARAPGMFLNRLNPYRSSTEQRKALMEAFRRSEVAWGNRDLRLELMDEQGIHAAIMFPGHVLNLEYEFAGRRRRNPCQCAGVNRWIHAEVGHAHQGRLFLPPYISLADVDLAVAELERMIDEGAPLVEVVTGHAHGGRGTRAEGARSRIPLRPFWARMTKPCTRCDPRGTDRLPEVWRT